MSAEENDEELLQTADDMAEELLKRAEEEEEEYTKKAENAEEQECVMLANAEEFLSKNNVVMLPYQKQMFLDLVYMDGLIVCAK